MNYLALSFLFLISQTHKAEASKFKLAEEDLLYFLHAIYHINVMLFSLELYHRSPEKNKNKTEFLILKKCLDE